MKRKFEVILAAASRALSIAPWAKANAGRPASFPEKTTLPKVIRGYLPLLVGIAVAVVDLHQMHRDSGSTVPDRPAVQALAAHVPAAAP